MKYWRVPFLVAVLTFATAQAGNRGNRPDGRYKNGRFLVSFAYQRE